MLLKYYYTTPLEDWVHTLYEGNGIYSTEDLDEEVVADSLDIYLSKSESESHYVVTDVFNMIVVDEYCGQIEPLVRRFEPLFAVN
ncbi:hypothetical protein [Alkalihalobacterium alkalinitrilicum]|uniref:hypothetical protein n=1 Tax=Alkalihalobacterium alkalinitrilicum TaxID=427920 RepID=UPI001C5993EF|nr:hypothetical protein [Alkalihalobacterium alkalinitrilicum]